MSVRRFSADRNDGELHPCRADKFLHRRSSAAVMRDLYDIGAQKFRRVRQLQFGFLFDVAGQQKISVAEADAQNQ